MKILLVTPYFYPKIGGVERHTYNIAKGLIRAGHNVHVVTTKSDPSYPTNETINGIYVTRLPISFTISMTPINLGWLKELRKLIREFDPDIIEAHAPVPGLADLAYFARQGRKYVIKYHAGDMKKGKSWLIDSLLAAYQNTFLKYIFLHADAIMAVYPNYVEKLINHQRTVHFIPPGVDTKLFKPKVTKKIYDVLYVGRIEHASDWKGVDVLLESIAKSKKKHKKINVALVGTGDAIDHFKSLTAKLGIADNVSFLGSVHGEDLVKIYNSSRVLVLPSLTEAESFGNVLIEAMACRVPVIGSNVGGIPNVITEGKDGYLFTPGSSTELARHINTILSDQKLARKMGDNGFDKATDVFSVHMLNKKTEDLLRNTTATRINHVTTSYAPSIGGMQEAVKSIVHSQRDSGLSAFVIAPSPGSHETDYYQNEKYVTRLSKIQVSHTKIIPGLLHSLLKLRNDDVNHLHVAHAFLPEMALVAYALKRFRYYAHIHFDFTPSTKAGKILIPIYRFIVLGPFLRRAHKVIVPTLDYKNMLVSTYNLNADKVFIIPNGTTLEIAKRARKGISKKKRVNMIFVGRMGFQKNISGLIELMNRLVAIKNSNKITYTLHLVGDGELRDQLEKQIAAHKLNNHIVLHGAKSQAELQKLYDKSDLFVSTSLYESFGIVLIEAMSRGLPIVAHDIMGSRNVAIQDVNGLLSIPQDYDQSIKNILKLTGSDFLYEKISKRNLVDAHKYRWPNIVKSLRDVYED